mmetsp:Transcript_46970/g.134045  ORF Transcript_46970/g.134045 Transcript_46970/m.134045 type:complete len:333 (-) Transcript_46970:1283-2281(-)
MQQEELLKLHAVQLVLGGHLYADDRPAAIVLVPERGGRAGRRPSRHLILLVGLLPCVQVMDHRILIAREADTADLRRCGCCIGCWRDKLNEVLATAGAYQCPAVPTMMPTYPRPELDAALHALQHLPIRHPAVLTCVRDLQALLLLHAHGPYLLYPQGGCTRVILELGKASCELDGVQEVLSQDALRAVRPQHADADGLGPLLLDRRVHQIPVAEELLHGVERVAVAVGAAAAKHDLPGQQQGLGLQAGVLGAPGPGPLQEPQRHVRSEDVHGGLLHGAPVQADAVARQVRVRLLQVLEALRRTNGATLSPPPAVPNPLQRNDHRLVGHLSH